MASLLRSLSRRSSLYTKLLCSKTSSPLRFHYQSYFEERKQVCFVQGLVSFRHMSCTPQESSIKFDTFVELPAETMVTKVSSVDECTATIGSFTFPEDFVQYVVNGVHELTGFNWWISIALTAYLVNRLVSPVTMRAHRTVWEIEDLDKTMKRLKGCIQNGDPKDVAKYKKREEELVERKGKKLWSFLNLFALDAFIYASFICGISTMAKKIPSFDNGGIFWFTDLSTPDSLYILPLLTGYTFWWTAQIRRKHVSGMKRLSVFLIIFTALQATYQLESAVYLYMISTRIYICRLVLTSRTNKIVKFRSILGWPEVPVTTVVERQRVMERVVSLMREFNNVVKKKKGDM